VDIILDFNTGAIVIGIFVALVLPFCAMAEPILQETSIELRDALDVFRNKVQTLKVIFNNLQSNYGLSVE